MLESVLVMMTILLEAAFFASHVPDAISLVVMSVLLGVSFTYTLSCVGLEWTFKKIKTASARLIFR